MSKYFKNEDAPKPKETTEEDFCTWVVNRFPRHLKNRVIAEAKIQNRITPDLLEEIVSNYFEKEPDL